MTVASRMIPGGETDRQGLDLVAGACGEHEEREHLTFAELVADARWI
jgi:hypothetical protein